MARTVEEGQRMVAELVTGHHREEEDGEPQTGPEAQAEEERQLGSLRARKLNCKVYTACFGVDVMHIDWCAAAKCREQDELAIEDD